MTGSNDTLAAGLGTVSVELGAATALVLAPASLRWRVIAASVEGLGDDPIRAGIHGDLPDDPVPAVAPAASLCKVLGTPPSHAWWCPVSNGRVFVVYWTGAPTVTQAQLQGAALKIVRELPGMDPQDRDGREILLNVIDVLATGLIYHDDDGRRIIVNQAGRQILALGEGVVTLHDARTALERFCGGDQVQGQAGGLEVTRQGRIYQVRSELIQFAFGSGVLWRLEDVTTESHQRARLAEAKRAALMADVAGGVGHQFNNLLARVICQAEAVQDATSTAEASALAEQIIETSEASATVVRHLMTYAGGAVVDCDAVDLSVLIPAWVAAVGPGPSLALEGCQGLVIADSDLFRASLDELHLNAVRAGATKLSIRCVAGVSGRLDVQVADNGMGMTAEDCLRAPDPFFTRGAVGEGSGLGLSMVKGAMRQCGGDLYVDSAPGQGTTVTLSLVACAA